MLNVVIIVVALILAAYLALPKRLASSSDWKATVTPLASIMGSGFLWRQHLRLIESGLVVVRVAMETFGHGHEML